MLVKPDKSVKHICLTWFEMRHDYQEQAPHLQGLLASFVRCMPPDVEHLYIFYHGLHHLHGRAMGLENTRVHIHRFMEALLVSSNVTWKWQPVPVNITDPLDLPSVHHGTSERLHELRKKYPLARISVGINGGYQMMQLSWMLCTMSAQFGQMQLWQVRKPFYTKENKPELVEVQLEQNPSYYHIMATHSQQQDGAPGGDAEIYLNDALKTVYQKAELYARFDDIPVLIIGDSGTGKEHLAQYIHKASPRRKRAYHVVNCGAFSDEFLRSELFGHNKNAFTGAQSDRKGLLEEAKGGTLVLDEVGELSPYSQQALLRLLQNGQYYRMGEDIARIADVRIVASTNRNLEEAVEKGRFRADLYYRLAGTVLHLPSWNEFSPEQRSEQLLQMISKFNARMQKLAYTETLELSPEAIEYCIKRKFKGNLRQLNMLLKRLYVECEHKQPLTVQQIEKVFSADKDAQQLSYEGSFSMAEAEKNAILRALAHTGGNKAQAAALLEVALNTLKNKMKIYGIATEGTVGDNSL